MTKADILKEIEKEFYKLGEVSQADASQAGQAVREREGITWYLVGVYERNGNVLLRRNISIYVANEGKPNEQAFYAEKKPENMLAKPVANEWAGVDGEVVRQGKGWAVVRRWKKTQGKAEEIEVLVEKVAGALTEYEIVKSVTSEPSPAMPTR